MGSWSHSDHPWSWNPRRKLTVSLTLTTTWARPGSGTSSTARPAAMTKPMERFNLGSIVFLLSSRFLSLESEIVPDIPVLGLLDEDRPHHEGHDGHDDRVPEPRVDVPLRRHHGGRQQGKHSAEPSVADVVRQRHRGVSDAGREELD